MEGQKMEGQAMSNEHGNEDEGDEPVETKSRPVMCWPRKKLVRTSYGT
jgi:hypothetical protein